jgi:hypothetical protein
MPTIREIPQILKNHPIAFPDPILEAKAEFNRDNLHNSGTSNNVRIRVEEKNSGEKNYTVQVKEEFQEYFWSSFFTKTFLSFSVMMAFFVFILINETGSFYPLFLILGHILINVFSIIYLWKEEYNCYTSIAFYDTKEGAKEFIEARRNNIQQKLSREDAEKIKSITYEK